jgi:signal transduction histidine kinase
VKQRRWSLAGRLTTWFVLSTTIVVVGIASISDFYMQSAVNRELDVLTEARLKDLRVQYELAVRDEKDATRYPDIFCRLADQISRSSPNPIAWRTWSAMWNWQQNDAGAKEILSDNFPRQEIKGATTSVGDGRRWRTEMLQDGLDVGIVLDGSSQIAMVRRYEALAGVVLACSSVIGLAIGAFFLRRVSDTLKRVADSARRVQEPATTVDVDITGAPDEIRGVVDALHELLANIRAATEKHRVLYASMAHELRAPLQNLIGATEVALLARRDAGAYRKVLESNLEELRELGDAIDNLMTICAPRANGTAPRVVEEFDLIEEASLRLARERNHAEQRGIDLHIATSGDTHMRGDRESVLRALRNLVANAIEWSSRDGTIDVAIDGQPGAIRVTVDDAGPGVPVEVRQQIFDPFFRGPSAHGRRVGYGLGLAIVRDAAELHGGSIAVATSPAGGARFVLELPRTTNSL